MRSGYQGQKERMKRLKRKISDLRQQERRLEREHQELALWHHILVCCCELLHWMLSSPDIHKGWQVNRDELLPEEIPLMQQLLAHPIDNTFSNPAQKPQLLDLFDQQQEASGDSGPQQTQSRVQQQQQQCGMTDAAFRAPGSAAGQDAFLIAPGDFLGVFRNALQQPPENNIQEMTVEGWAAHYRDYLGINQDMLCVLDCLKTGQQVPQYSGPHPVVVMREHLVQHIQVVASILLLHPDDLLNRVRMLNHESMQLEDCADDAWQRMWEVVEHLGLTGQQKFLISVGCGVFTRLMSAVIAERQQLVAQQQELFQLDNGRSVDLQQQQACAERLQVVVRKERFISQCLGVFVAGICSVVQLAKLSLLYFPYSPQIAVMGSVLTKKLEQQKQRQEQERKRRRRGLVPISPELLSSRDG